MSRDGLTLRSSSSSLSLGYDLAVRLRQRVDELPGWDETGLGRALLRLALESKIDPDQSDEERDHA